MTISSRHRNAIRRLGLSGWENIPPDRGAPYARGMAGFYPAPRKTNSRRPDPPPHHRQRRHPQAPKSKKLDQGCNQRHHQQHGVDRLVLHFTPTSSSWMNLVERFFRDLTVDGVRAGSFTSIGDLVASTEAYLAERDLAPKRYVWKAEGQEILRKIHRAEDALAKTSGKN
jgi:hypothetical protein